MTTDYKNDPVAFIRDFGPYPVHQCVILRMCDYERTRIYEPPTESALVIILPVVYRERMVVNITVGDLIAAGDARLV